MSTGSKTLLALSACIKEFVQIVNLVCSPAFSQLGLGTRGDRSPAVDLGLPAPRVGDRRLRLAAACLRTVHSSPATLRSNFM